MSHSKVQFVNDEIEVINRTLKILTSHDDFKNRYAANIKILEERLIAAKHNYYRLGVIGITSCGKSTMINALLEEPLLPMRAKPTSNQLVSCRHGKDREALVFFEDGRTQSLKGKQLEEIKGYTDESLNPHNKKGVRQIDIISPKFPFDERIVLIDSPGLDAFGLENHDKLTMNSLLPTIDLCVFMTTFKPSSDERNRSVLNAMAQHEKPVIIIQNMIDAILPSPDGKQTVDDVVQDHKRRLERIVQASDIEDKSKVQIVQYSATWALQARVENDNISSRAKRSNHQALIETIKNTFDTIKPDIDGYRLRIVKRQLDEIIEDANKDSKGIVTVEPFKFQNSKSDIIEKIDHSSKQIEDCIKSLNSARRVFLNNDEIYQEDLDEVTEGCERACLKINNIKNKLSNAIKALCKSLNMSHRELFAFEPISYRRSEMTVETKPEHRREESWVPGGRVTRWLGRKFNTDWGYKDVYIDVPDHQASKRKGINQYDTTLTLCNNDFSRFEKTYSKLIDEIGNRIDLLRKEHDDRIHKALTAKRYQEIADNLSMISMSIQLPEPVKASSLKEVQNDYSNLYKQIEVSRSVYGTYQLAQIIKLRIHHKIAQVLFQPSKRDTIIWGQDKSSECHFIKQAFGLTIAESDIKDGFNYWKSIRLGLLHNQVVIKSDKNSNVILLVNSTQIGERFGRESILKIAKRINQNCNIFLVAQNFQENINGRNTDETVDNMLSLGVEMKLSTKPKILFAHNNPIFNMVALEAQQFGFKTQKEEIELTSDLRSKFGFLINDNMDIIQSIIRQLNRFK